MSVLAAWAISTHGVRVTLSAEPLHADSFGEGDALNPAVWSVVNLATGAALTVATAVMNDATSVDLSTIDALGDDLETHEVTATGLFAADDSPAVAPLSAQFIGVVQTVDPIDAARLDFRDRDLANPPFPSSVGSGYGGTLVIGADGDFVTDSGDVLTRKLVLRRLNTPLGAFRHLPTYGVAQPEKEPPGAGGDLVAYLREVEKQAGAEPDVTRAVARGSMSRTGVLVIQLSVTTRGSGTIGMRLGRSGGRFAES